MKKIIIFIICIVIVILSVFSMKYLDYKEAKNSIKKDNLEYEFYLNNNITGRELTTAINRAVDNNEKNKVAKDKDGNYISNDVNSIKIEIRVSDDDNKIYQMETIYSGRMETFIQYYGDILFKCTKIDYNKEGRVCYILFEQIDS